MLAVPGKSCLLYENIITTGPSLDAPEFKAIIDFESTEGQEFLAYLQNNTGFVSKQTKSKEHVKIYFVSTANRIVRCSDGY